MSSPQATFTLQRPGDFERNVTRAVVGGAGAGLLQLLAYRALGVLGIRGPGAFPASTEDALLPLAYLAIAVAVAICARGDRLDRVLLTGAGVVLPALPWLLGFSPAWAVGGAGAVGGALLVHAQARGVGEERTLGRARAGRDQPRPRSRPRGLLAVAGREVAAILSLKLVALAAPAALVAVVGGATFALFFGLSQIAGHVALEPDPVEQRGAELLSRLSGELRTLGDRILGLYRACGALLEKLPREPEREQLAQSLAKSTTGALEVAAEWSAVEAQLDKKALADLAAQISELRQSAASSQDALARRQLTNAADSLDEEKSRLDALTVKRERVIARLRSEAALLERARISLVGVQLGNAELRAAELGALSRRLEALAVGQSDQGALAGEVAQSMQELEKGHDTSLPVKISL